MPATLVGLLKEDAILYSDGGGKTRAALNPIYGSDKIIRFVQGLLKKLPGELGGYSIEVNGGPGAIVTLGGHPHTVVAIEPDGDRISTVYYMLNPDKLPVFADIPQ